MFKSIIRTFGQRFNDELHEEKERLKRVKDKYKEKGKNLEAAYQIKKSAVNSEKEEAEKSKELYLEKLNSISRLLYEGEDVRHVNDGMLEFKSINNIGDNALYGKILEITFKNSKDYFLRVPLKTLENYLVKIREEDGLSNEESEADYYIYENWRANGHIARLHYGVCGFCNHGKGPSGKGTQPKNGKWHGPFGTLKEAELVAKNTGANIFKHCV